MFGIDDILLASLIGGGAGAVFNKKDPMKGALLGAGLGAGGAYLAPGLLGGGAAAGTTGTAAGAAGTAAGTEAGLLGTETGINSMGYLAPEMTGTVAEQAAAPVVNMNTQAGMFDTMNHQTGGLLGRTTDTMSKLQKPLGTAATATTLAKNLMPQDQPMQPSPIAPPTATGPQGLQQLAGQNDQLNQQRQQSDYEQRKKRQDMITRMRGY